MKFACPKCGRQITVTNSELVALKGTIVCPQCLTATTVPYKKPSSPATPPPRRTAAKPYSSPPPRRSAQSKPVINFSDSGGYGYSSNSNRNSRPARKPTKSSKPSRTSSLLAVSSFGCFWRSVAFTAVLFVIYVLFGKLIEM